MPERGHGDGSLSLHEDTEVCCQVWLMVSGKLVTSDEVSRKQSSPDLSFLCLSDKGRGNHLSDPSYSTSSSKEY